MIKRLTGFHKCKVKFLGEAVLMCEYRICLLLYFYDYMRCHNIDLHTYHLNIGIIKISINNHFKSPLNDVIASGNLTVVNLPIQFVMKSPY